MSQTLTRKNWLITEISSGLGRSPAEAAPAQGQSGCRLHVVAQLPARFIGERMQELG
jgi:hypothetical protein